MLRKGDPEWTEEKKATLTKLWLEGLSTAEIGRRLHVTKDAVIGKAHRLKLPPRPSPIKFGVGPRPIPIKIPRAPKQTLAPVGDGVLLIPTERFPQTSSTPQPLNKGRGAARRPAIRGATLADVVKQAPPKRGLSRAKECCFPLSDRRPWRFCEKPTVPGSPYCEKHHAMAYRAQEVSRG